LSVILLNIILLLLYYIIYTSFSITIISIIFSKSFIICITFDGMPKPLTITLEKLFYDIIIIIIIRILLLLLILQLL